MSSALGSQVYSQYVGTATQEWTEEDAYVWVCVCVFEDMPEKRL